MRLYATILTTLVFAGTANAEPLYDPLVVVDPVSAIVRADDESALIVDVNRARSDHGLSAVASDELLARAAQEHARNMAARRFFGHTSPDGESLPDRLAKVGFAWSVAAENIALAADEREANETLLESPAHRANILDGRVSKIGVAALGVGKHATLYVEDFAR